MRILVTHTHTYVTPLPRRRNIIYGLEPEDGESSPPSMEEVVEAAKQVRGSCLWVEWRWQQWDIVSFDTINDVLRHAP